MNRIWANRLEAGTQSWTSVPASRKAAVREILRGDAETGYNSMTPDRFKEITGEDY
jgi:hypothetical protein